MGIDSIACEAEFDLNSSLQRQSRRTGWSGGWRFAFQRMRLIHSFRDSS